MSALVRAASSLLSKASSMTDQQDEARTTAEDEQREKAEAVYTLVISGSHGMVGTYLLELLRDPALRIDGRRVRCRRLIRTRKIPSQRSLRSTQASEAEKAPSVVSPLPPRPEFLPSPAETPPPHAFKDAAETPAEQGDETARKSASAPRVEEALEAKDPLLPAGPAGAVAFPASPQEGEAATAVEKREVEGEEQTERQEEHPAQKPADTFRKATSEDKSGTGVSAELPKEKEAIEDHGVVLAPGDEEEHEKDGRPSIQGREHDERSSSGEGERRAQIETEDIYWDIPGQWIEAEKLEGVDAVLHLAGEPLAEKGEVAGERAVDRANLSDLEEVAAKEDPALTEGAQAVGGGSLGARLKSFIDSEEWLRSLGAWTEKKKKEIIESRTLSTRLLVNTFRKLKKPPAHFFVASGVGVYGIGHKDDICDENTEAGNTFVAETSIELEREAAAAAPRDSAVFKVYASPTVGLDSEEHKEEEDRSDGKTDFAGCRVVFLRFGVIFSTRGGILPRLLPLYKLRFGARLGNGQQWMSWVSLYDAAQAILFLLEKGHEDIQGPVNVCSPRPMRNFELASQLHAVLHPRAWLAFTLPVPAVVLRLVLGQLADEVLLGGQRVVPRRLESADFAFAHLDIADALRWSLEDQKLEKEKASIVFAEERQAALLQEWKEEQPEALERLSAAAEAVNRQQLELRKQLQESEHLLETRRQEQVLKRHQSKVQQLLQRRESARSEDGSKEPTADAGNEDGNGAKQVEPAAL